MNKEREKLSYGQRDPTSKSPGINMRLLNTNICNRVLLPIYCRRVATVATNRRPVARPRPGGQQHATSAVGCGRLGLAVTGREGWLRPVAPREEAVGEGIWPAGAGCGWPEVTAGWPEALGYGCQGWGARGLQGGGGDSFL